MYTLDTNAIIYFLKADAKAGPTVRKLIESTATLYISTITEIELFGFPQLTPEEAYDLDQLLVGFTVIPVDSRLARFAASLRRLHHLKVPDAAIAATALATGSELVTRNTKDFRNISQLKLRKI